MNADKIILKQRKKNNNQNLILILERGHYDIIDKDTFNKLIKKYYK